MLHAVAQGIGLGVMSYRLVERAIDHKVVVPIYVEGLDLNRKFYIIRRKGKKLPTAVQCFLDVSRNYVSPQKKNDY